MQGLLDPSWEVEVFTDGLSVYRKVHQQPPDLLITDLMLPRLDGFLMVGLLKYDSRFEDLPILCVSSILESDLNSRLRQLGAEEFLPKPLDPERFQATVANLLG